MTEAIRLPSKLERVLEHLIEGHSLNRFEAETRVNDHCLHSTMSTMKNKLGICYSKQSEVVPGWSGSPTRVTRYWLEQNARLLAQDHLKRMRQDRGASRGSRS